MKLVNQIERHYNDALNSEDVYNYTENLLDWVKECDDLKLIKELIPNEIHIMSSKIRHPDNDVCIRMVLVIKDKTRGRVRNLRKVMDVVGDIETALVFLDSCAHDKFDDRIYLDVLKNI